MSWALALTLALSALGTGCSGGSDQATGDKTVLRYTWWGNPDRAERTEKAISLFEKQHPRIDIQTSFAGYEAYKQKLATQAAAWRRPRRHAARLPPDRPVRPGRHPPRPRHPVQRPGHQRHRPRPPRHRQGRRHPVRHPTGPRHGDLRLRRPAVEEGRRRPPGQRLDLGRLGRRRTQRLRTHRQARLRRPRPERGRLRGVAARPGQVPLHQGRRPRLHRRRPHPLLDLHRRTAPRGSRLLGGGHHPGRRHRREHPTRPRHRLRRLQLGRPHRRLGPDRR